LVIIEPELTHADFIECELTHIGVIFGILGGNEQNHLGKKQFPNNIDIYKKNPYDR